MYLTQNRENYAVCWAMMMQLIPFGNLPGKIVMPEIRDTNEWAAKLLGERWIQVSGTNVSRSDQGASGGVSRSEQRRYFVEPSRFTTLKRGGDVYGLQVECIVYKGGHLFDDGQPFRLLTFNQQK